MGRKVTTGCLRSFSPWTNAGGLVEATENAVRYAEKYKLTVSKRNEKTTHGITCALHINYICFPLIINSMTFQGREVYNLLSLNCKKRKKQAKISRYAVATCVSAKHTAYSFI